MGQQQVTVVTEEHVLMFATARTPAAAQAGLSVANKHRNSHSARRVEVVAGGHRHGEAVRKSRRITFLTLRPLRLVAVVLEPDLDLRRRQPNETGQVLALGGGQVPLLLEPPLQFERLLLREQNAALSLLPRHRIARLQIAANATLVVKVQHTVIVLLVVLVARMQQIRVALLTGPRRLQVAVRVLFLVGDLVTIAITMV